MISLLLLLQITVTTHNQTGGVVIAQAGTVICSGSDCNVENSNVQVNTVTSLYIGSNEPDPAAQIRNICSKYPDTKQQVNVVIDQTRTMTVYCTGQGASYTVTKEGHHEK